MKSSILATALLSIAHAFTPAILGSRYAGHGNYAVKTSALNLLPDQGCELAAASSAAEVLAKAAAQLNEVITPVNATGELSLHTDDDFIDDDDVAYFGNPESHEEVHDSMEKIHPSEM